MSHFICLSDVVINSSEIRKIQFLFKLVFFICKKKLVECPKGTMNFGASDNRAR